MNSSAGAPARWMPYRWLLIVLLWCAFFLNQGDRQIFSIVLPLIQADLGLTSVQMGLVASVFTLVLGVMFPFAGYAGDHWDKKWILTISLLLWSLATVFTGWGTGLVSLLLFRSLATGCGESFYGPAANALIGEHHKETRAVAMSVHQTALYVGVVVSGFGAGWLGEHYGWRSTFFIFGFAGVVLALVLAVYLRASRPAGGDDPNGPPIGETLAYLGSRHTMFALLLAFSAMIFVNVAYLTWTPTFFHEKFHMSLADAGFKSMFYHHGAAFAGVLAGGWLSDRYARRRPRIRLELQAFSLLAGAPFIYLTGAAETQTIACVGLAGFGLFRGMYDSNIYASLFEVIAPRYRASACSAMVCGAFVTASSAPLLLGWAKGAVGLSFAISAMWVLYVLGAISILVGVRRCFERERVLER